MSETNEITPADVERCRQRAHVLRHGTPWAPKVESMQPSAAELEEAREWDALAAKLAALLPPEDMDAAESARRVREAIDADNAAITADAAAGADAWGKLLPPEGT